MEILFIQISFIFLSSSNNSIFSTFKLVKFSNLYSISVKAVFDLSFFPPIPMLLLLLLRIIDIGSLSISELLLIKFKFSFFLILFLLELTKEFFGFFFSKKFEDFFIL